MSLGGGAASSALACMAVGFVLLVPMFAQNVNCASLAAFNLRSKFSALTFKVAPLRASDKDETLSLVTPDGSVKDVTLKAGQETQTVTVNVNNVNEFAFFLSFTDNGSVPFALFDMTLTAKKMTFCDHKNKIKKSVLQRNFDLCEV